jgi:hypothetical protein
MKGMPMTTTETDTYHDIEPHAVRGNGMASARCRTHQAETAEQWPTMGEAARGFRCDGGLGLRFVTESSGDGTDPVAAMRDLSGLARVISADAEARAYAHDDARTSAWLWHSGGRVEALQITLDHMGEFDEDDYATQTWKVTGADGRDILTVPVRIDGRA